MLIKFFLSFPAYNVENVRKKIQKLISEKLEFFIYIWISKLELVTDSAKTSLPLWCSVYITNISTNDSKINRKLPARRLWFLCKQEVRIGERWFLIYELNLSIFMLQPYLARKSFPCLIAHPVCLSRNSFRNFAINRVKRDEHVFSRIIRRKIKSIMPPGRVVERTETQDGSWVFEGGS